MAGLAGKSQDMFVRTNEQLEEMVVSMDEINESSGKISKIIKVIDEIAFQTNILTLNAPVEAAAGRGWHGFAVVADEVRNLGMDVVKRNVQKRRGRIDTQSVAGSSRRPSPDRPLRKPQQHPASVEVHCSRHLPEGRRRGDVGQGETLMIAVLWRSAESKDSRFAVTPIYSLYGPPLDPMALQLR